jgi:exopolysaccharide biosynthesis WecB/TagA/CpsF family protein
MTRTSHDGLPGDVPRIAIFGLKFHALDCEEAVSAIRARAPDAGFGYLTTPNVDHIVRLLTEAQTAEVHRAYSEAEMTLCDSRVMGLLARLRGVHLKVAPGSDVTAMLLKAEQGSADPMVLIGGASDTVPRLERRYGLTGLRQHIPPLGLLHDDAALDAAADFIAANPARYVFIAVGSPQQEVVALRAAQRAGATGFGLCVGASIDYLTGRSRRAPAILRRLALEWLFRLACEPRRLWRRYLVRSPRIFRLLNREKPGD